MLLARRSGSLFLKAGTPAGVPLACEAEWEPGRSRPTLSFPSVGGSLGAKMDLGTRQGPRRSRTCCCQDPAAEVEFSEPTLL